MSHEPVEPEQDHRIGQPFDRTDGVLKVTGQARYSADNNDAKLTHAVLITSTIAKGRIASIDTSRAQALPGVRLVMTYQNAMRLPNGGVPDAQPPAVRKLTLLQTSEVRYSNEPMAVVIADTFEHAQGAVRYVDISATKARYRTPTISACGPRISRRII